MRIALTGTIKIFIIILLSIHLSFEYAIDQMKNENEIRKVFYSRLLKKYQFVDRVEIKISDDGKDLFMISKMHHQPNEPIVGIENKFFFTSCDFYPFIETVIKALIEYCKLNDKNFENYFLAYSLIYNILYFKLGNRKQANEYYKNYFDLSHLKKNSYLRFDIDLEVKEYLEIMSKHTHKSSLKYNKEELILSQNLLLNINFREESLKVFEYVKEYVSENSSEEVRNSMSSFINNKEEFLNISTLIANKIFFFEERYYAGFYRPGSKTEYGNIKSIIFPHGYKMPSACRMIAPFLDLVKFVIPQNLSDKLEVNVSKINDNFTGIPTNKGVQIGEIVKSSFLDRINNNEFFSFTGELVKDNIYHQETFIYSVDKSKLNEDQVLFCKSITCIPNFDILSFWTNPHTTQANIPFSLFRKNLNIELFNFLKLIYIKKPNQNLVPFFQSGWYINYNIETRGLIDYYSLLHNMEKNIILENLFSDYKKIKRIQTIVKDFNEEMLPQLGNLTKYDFDIMRKMYKLAIDRKVTIMVNTFYIISVIHSNAAKDIKSHKSKYLNIN